MASFKSLQQSKNIALVPQMNERSNPVYLNKAQTDSSYFLYLQNIDAYNKQSISSRLGTTPFVEGQCQFPIPIIKEFEYNITTIPSGTTEYTFQNTSTDQPNFDVFAGMFIVPSGDINFFKGSINAISALVVPTQLNQAEYLYDIDFKLKLYTLNQISQPQIGLGTFSGNGVFSNNSIYDIALSGTYPSSPHPAIAVTTPVPTTNLIAVASASGVDFGSYTFDLNLSQYVTTEKQIDFTFGAPVPLYSGNVYFMTVEPHLTSGTSQRSLGIKYIHENDETGINTRLGITQPGGGGSQFISELGQEKSQLYTTIYGYASPVYILDDDYLATEDMSSPLISGSNFTGANSIIHTADQLIVGVPNSATFNGATRVPNISTDTVEFGSLSFIPSGTHLIQGAYFYATPNDRPEYASFTRNKQRISGTGYQLGYICNLSEIISSSGSLSGGDFTIINRNIINTFSGTYTFDNFTNDIAGTNNSFVNSEYNLNKIYSIFSNPSVVNTNGANYLISFKYFDATTGGKYTDYSYKNVTSGPFSPTTIFQSFMMNGVMLNHSYPSGTYLSNRSDDGQTFIMPSGDAVLGDPRNNNLTCGIITTASGASINGIVDYTTSTLSQRIVYNQGDKMKYFLLNDRSPTNHVVIKSGLTVNPDALASYQVYDDLLLETNYSFDKPQVWDSTYVNTSGNSTYDLGQRPAFSLSLVSGTSNLVSGTYSVMLTTEMLSGGFRSSIPQTIEVSGLSSSGSTTNVAIAISGINIADQYPFDIVTDSTAIFMTLPSGIAPNGDTSVFYLANVASGVSSGSSYYTNPIPNNINIGYINNLNGVSDTIIEDVYPEVNQAYMLNQLDTPLFKKVTQYYDYILGFGDKFASRLYWSQQFSPQIYGGISSEYGYTPIADSTGDPITGIAHWKNYMLIFKKNSLFRMDYTAQSIPFSIDPISVEMGCLSLFSVVETDDYVYGINQYGIFRANANGIECISKDIDYFFHSLNTDQLTFSTGIKNTQRNEIYWSITNDTFNETNTFGLVYNYEFNSLSVRQGGLWNSASVIRNIDSFDILLGGTYDGQIKQLDVGNADVDLVFSDGIVSSSTGIQFVAQSEWTFFDNDSTNKIIDRLHFNINANSGYLLVDIYLDGNTTPKYTRKVNLAGNSPDKICNLGGIARSLMWKIRNVNTKNAIKIDSYSIDYQVIGLDKPM